MKHETAHPALMRRIDLLYRRLKSGDCDAAELEWLAVLDWQSGVFQFDRRSGHVAVERLSDVLNRAALRSDSSDRASGDLLYRLAARLLEHARAVSANLKSKLLREHAELRLHAVREFDSKALVALSRQRGRTVREKLADRATVLAPRRVWTFDTIENRLFRTLCVRVVPLLALRHENQQLHDTKTTALMEVMQRWLRSDAAADIGPLQSFTPNNILLQDPDYRPVWDAWRSLQSMDSRMEGDLTDTGLEARGLDRMVMGMMLVEIASRLASRSDMFLLEQPVQADSQLHRVLAADDETLSAILWWSGQGGLQVEIAIVEGTPPSLVITLQRAGDGREIDYLVSIDNVLQRSGQDSVGQVKEWAAGLAVELFGDTQQRARHLKDGNPREAREERWSALDLCEVVPASVTESEPEQMRSHPALLWQSWEVGGSRFGMGLGDACGVRLDDEIPTRSMLDAFRNSGTEADESTWVEHFSDVLRNQLGLGWVTYLVPDAASEFCWRRLRRAMQMQYSGGRSRPVPRSIGLAADAAGRAAPMTHEAAYIVVDGAADSVSVTRITVRPVNSAPSQQRRGGPLHDVRLERHPPAVLDSPCSDTGFLKTRISAGIPVNGERVAELLGWTGIETVGSDLMLKSGERWISPRTCFRQAGTVPDGAADELRKTIAGAVNEAKIGGASDVTVIFEPSTRARIRLLGWEKLTVRPFMAGDTVRVLEAEPGSAIRGALAAAVAERELGDPIWTNHLPKLAIRDDSRTLIYLVSGKKGQALVPRFGKRELISEIVIQLSTGRRSFTFPVVQGEADRETGYLCTLESPDFPLSQPERHKFRLFYEYGAENPYTLECASSKHLRTFWKSGEPELLNATPAFPDLALDVASGRQIAAEALDLLWCACGAPKHTARVKNKVFKSEENQFLFAAFSDGCADAFVHRSSFVNYSEFDVLERGDDFKIGFMEISRAGRGLAGRHAILLDSELDVSESERFFSDKPPVGSSLQNKLKWRLRSLTAGPNSFVGHLSPECHADLHEVSDLLSNRNLPSSNNSEIAFFLASLQGDAPPSFSEWLIGAVSQSKPSGGAVGVALGNLDCEWQRNLIDAIFDRLTGDLKTFDSSLLGELGVAIWRSETLVFALSAKRIEVLLAALTKAMKQDLLELERLVQRGKGRLPWNFAQRLTLLLGLLRTRSSSEPRIAAVLAAGSVQCRAFLSIVDALSENLEVLLSSSLSALTRKDLKCHIELDLPPEPVRSNRPEIIRALQVFLSGANESAGVLVSVSESED